MPKSTININFASGLDTKTDPWQVAPGKFLVLQNRVFEKGGLLSKRSGYGPLTQLPVAPNYLTTLNDNLLAVGKTISAYSSSTGNWVTKGQLQPASVSVLPLIRNNVNQVYADSAVSNNLVCTTYTQSYTTATGQVTKYLIAVADATTGQNIIKPTPIPTLSGGTVSGSHRVFVVANFFVIVGQVQISSTNFLQYVSIPTNNPKSISAAQNVYPEAYVAPAGTNLGWDGAVADGSIVVAYNTTTGGQGVHVTSLLASQIAANQTSGLVQAFTNSAYAASLLSVCVDATENPNLFFISFYNSATSTVYSCAVTTGFGSITTQYSPVSAITSVSVANLASAAQNNACLIMAEINNVYTYETPVPSNYIDAVVVSNTGTVGTPYIMARGVGLASKGFIVNQTEYVLAAFQSTYQPSYFLINASLSTAAAPIVVSKLAYQNGGGYLTRGLPSVTITGDTAQIAYLYKQDVEALNTLTNPQQTSAGGIYSQLGINLVSIEIGTRLIDSAEIGSNLNLSGGYLGMFDGYLPVEQGFFLFPDDVKAVYSASSTVTPTGTVTNGSFVVTAVSSLSGISPGMSISGGGIPAGALVVSSTGSTITMSLAANATHAAETITVQGGIVAQPDAVTNTNAYYYQATYEWTDMQGNAFRSQPSVAVGVTTTGTGTAGIITVNVPTLRLTAKIDTPVKIVIYRWSVMTQVYNEVTSITAPTLNDPTQDYVTFVDSLPDANVIGNNIIYTTGGVVPDTNGPACDVVTLFDTRLWLIDAEDRNLLWCSKTVVEGSPVEMSSLFTIYVAPNIGTTQSSGGMTAIAPMDDKLIIFKQNALYYINGVGPDDLGTTANGSPLGNYSQPTFITSVVGCTNPQSIVLTQDGLMFQSDKGIWLLNRSLQTSYIGAPVEQFNSSEVNSANVIPDTNYVLFTLNTGEMLMYDYYYQQWGTFVGAPTISSCIYSGLHTIINQFGEILQETPGAYLDGTNPVLTSLTTNWFNLANLQGYERFYSFMLLARYLSPHTLNIGVAYDYNASVRHQSTIRPSNFSPSAPSPFGVPTPFGSEGQLMQWKVDAKIQLCQSFQITISEVFDDTLGVIPGAGFTMSGLACQVLIKSGARPIKAANSVG